MLGRRILDPLCSETGGSEDGLGLLPIDTIFSADKHTRQKQGTTGKLHGVWAPLSGLPVSGYEIHMGRTEYIGDGDQETSIFANLTNEDPDGAVCSNVLGTYLHGIFDETPFRSALLNLLRNRKGSTCSAEGDAEALHTLSGLESARQTQDRQLDLLANVLRESLDWDLIYRAIGI